MKMKKINLDKVKNFLFDHGEKVALGTCLFLALVLGALGILRASSAARDDKGNTWTEAFKKEFARVQNLITAAKPSHTPEEVDKRLVLDTYKWDYREPSFQQGPYTHVAETNMSRRDNPKIFPVGSDVKQKQVHFDIFRGLVLKHETGTTTRKSKTIPTVKALEHDASIMKGPAQGPAGPQLPFLRVAQPQRMVVVTMVFPMKQQVAEYVRALRMKNQSELFASRDDLPKPVGFNLVRFEMQPNGQPMNPNGEVMIQADKDGKLTLSKSLKTFMRDVMFDEKFPEQLEPHIWAGLVMPTPKLAYGRLEKFDLAGIAVDWSDDAEPAKKMNDPKRKGEMPNPNIFKDRFKKPGGERPKDPKDPMEVGEGTIKDIEEPEVRKSFPGLATRLFDHKLNIFHPLGEIEPLAAPGVLPGGIRQPQFQPGVPQTERYFSAWNIVVKDADGEEKEKPKVAPMPRPGEQPGVQVPEVPDWNRDAIVRFIDPEVEPGKKYSYAIQIRFANPNFGKPALVAFDRLASLPELVSSEWATVTMPDPVPSEYALYAVDQPMLDDWATNPGNKPGPADAKFFRDHTSFQVHQWVRKQDNGRDEFIVGDWAIAERLMVRKGEFIGMNAVVQVPVWQKERDGFVMPKFNERDAKGKAFQRSGLRTDLMPPQTGKTRAVLPMPVLVDFHGGKKIKGTTIEEESAVDALIMNERGQLVVRNSREDSDSRNEAARERQERVKKTRDRVEELPK